MSLTVYDPRLGCHVLAPMKTEIINAFHPDYVKTYHPDFMKQFRTLSANKKASMTLSDHVEKLRETDPAVGYMNISKVPREIKAPKMMKVNLERKEFHIYQKAGAPK